MQVEACSRWARVRSSGARAAGRLPGITRQRIGLSLEICVGFFPRHCSLADDLALIFIAGRISFPARSCPCNALRVPGERQLGDGGVLARARECATYVNQMWQKERGVGCIQNLRHPIFRSIPN